MPDTGQHRAAGVGRARLPSLTNLRIFGSVAVVLCHVGNGFVNSAPLNVAAAYGYTGVSFFFMLSGFVLAWSYVADQPVRRFWWQRFSRIWPLQMLVMVFAWTALSADEKIPGTVGHVAEVLLIQSWFPDPSIYAGGNGVTWSLSNEMFFYLLFPFAMMLLRRLRGRGLGVVAAVTIAAMLGPPLVLLVAHIGMPDYLYYWLFFVFPPYRFCEFLLGMVLGRAMVLGLRVPVPIASCLVATAGIGWVIWATTIYTVHSGLAVPRPFVALLAVPFFALLLLATATRDLRPRPWWLGSRALQLLGGWSYALYLIHAPTLVVTAPLGWWNNPGGLWGVADFLGFLALTLAVAGALHHLVEKPIERRLRRIPVGS
ncbi:MAG: acyltransferase family protein [Streptosporangiaceae bacterium]